MSLPLGMDEAKEDGFCSKCAYVFEGIGCGSLAELPRKDQASCLYFDDNSEKDFTIEDASSIFHYEFNAFSGGLNFSATTSRKDETTYGDLDLMVPEDEVVGVYDTYEDFFWGIDDFSKTFSELDYYFSEDMGSGCGSGKSSSLSLSPGTSNEAVGSPVLSRPLPICQSNQIEKTTMTTTCESGGSCGSKYGCEMLMKDEKGVYSSSMSHSLEEFEESYNAASSVVTSDCYPLRDEMSIDSSDDIENVFDGSPASDSIKGNDLISDCIFVKKPSKSRNVGACVGKKRSRKPNNKYAQESSDSKRRSRKRRQDIASEENSPVDAKTLNRLSRTRMKAIALVACDPISGNSPKQELDESDEEYDPFRSNFKLKRCKKDVDRRKHNNAWTLSEVLNLVQGISQFGVGKWTAIQKCFFGSSPHRTSLDIRDKWRNLLRTSYTRLQGHKLDANNWKNGSIVLPETLIQRICELDSMHPYPGHDMKLSRGGSRDNSLSSSEQ